MTTEPTTAPEEPTPDYTADHVREYIQLQAEADRIKARMEEIKKFLRELDYGTHDIAGLKVSITRNPQFDSAAFQAKYPVLKFPHLYKSAIDAGAVKEHLAPAEVKKFYGEGEKKVGVK